MVAEYVIIAMGKAFVMDYAAWHIKEKKRVRLVWEREDAKCEALMGRIIYIVA